jgi:ribonuclease BN (tRNA processing enzyme)
LKFAYNIYKKFDLVKNNLVILIPYYDRNESDLDYYSYMQLKSYRNKNIHIVEVKDGEKFYYKKFTINFKRTYHDIPCNAIKIVSKDKSSIGYTSDTGNKSIDELSDFFKNVDLLISESTFLDSDNTLSDYHLHASETALLAKKSCCKQLMLTHFWPEHDPKKYIDEAKKIFNNVIPAEEGKTIKLKA